MHPNEQLIQTFYAAFKARQPEGMSACYHDEVTFSDPVFENLEGPEVGMMWRMLCRQAATLEIQATNISADDERGSADWVAIYPFGKANRKVHNKIHAEFRFKDGQIFSHVDTFDFWKWSRMALGPLGLFLGWNSVVKVNIQKQAMTNLRKFITITKTT